MAMKRTTNKQAQKALNELASFSNPVGEAGWFESAKYEDGTPVAYVASIQEYGHGPIPPRSFMRTTIADKREEWKGLFMDGAKAVVAGGESAGSVMDKVSSLAAGQVREKISKIHKPPLAESTKSSRRSRGNTSTKPLVDTGHMLATLTHNVSDK